MVSVRYNVNIVSGLSLWILSLTCRFFPSAKVYNSIEPESYWTITFSVAVYHAMQASCRFNFDAWMIDINIVSWIFSTPSPPHLDLSISLQPRPRCLHGHVIFVVSWFSHPLFCTFDGLASLHLNIPRKKKHLLVFGGKNVRSERVTRNRGTHSRYVRSVSNSCLS